MKRVTYWISCEYNELPAYSFVVPIDPYNLPKEYLAENNIGFGYQVCYTAKGLMQIPAKYIVEAI
jgi:hypothetical protein